MERLSNFVGRATGPWIVEVNTSVTGESLNPVARSNERFVTHGEREELRAVA